MSHSKYVILEGGLGNQLWQFAFAHKLAHFGTVTMVNIVEDKSELRFANRDNIIELLVDSCQHNIFYQKRERKKIHTRAMFVPNSRYFKINPLRAKANDVRRLNWREFMTLELSRAKSYLGYFQSISYLRDEVTFVLEELVQVLDIQGLKNTFSKETRGFVHIRGGDYLDPKHQNIFGVLDKAYYVRLQSFVPGNLNLDFYVFTDDAQRAKMLIPNLNQKNLYDKNKISEIQTLKMMATSEIACIANSTFSWWGGMLAMQNGGRMLVPFPWRVIEQESNEIVSDLYEEGFERVKASFQ